MRACAIELGLAVTIIALAGLSVITSATSFLAQPASATPDVMTNTAAEREEETASTTTNNTTINNVSNALLGRLFSYGEGEEEAVSSTMTPPPTTMFQMLFWAVCSHLGKV